MQERTSGDLSRICQNSSENTQRNSDQRHALVVPMLVRSCAFVVVPLIVVLLWYDYADGANCELRGFINNRVQCILHKREYVVKAAEEEVQENPLGWLDSIVKGVDDKINVATLEKCNKTVNCSAKFFEKLEEEFKRMVLTSVKGTKWCSDPSLTKKENVEVHKCCQKHHNCDRVIHANETKMGLSNAALHTRFHCDCDKEFYYCLKAAHNDISREIGYTYFTVLGPKCFKPEYPIVKCLAKIMERCREYKFEMEEPKKYQWFDNPVY